jgi:hypothetical protein
MGEEATQRGASPSLRVFFPRGIANYPSEGRWVSKDKAWEQIKLEAIEMLARSVAIEKLRTCPADALLGMFWEGYLHKMLVCMFTNHVSIQYLE